MADPKTIDMGSIEINSSIKEAASIAETLQTGTYMDVISNEDQLVQAFCEQVARRFPRLRLLDIAAGQP